MGRPLEHLRDDKSMSDASRHLRLSLTLQEGFVKDPVDAGQAGFVFFVPEAWGVPGFPQAELNVLRRLYLEHGVRLFSYEAGTHQMTAAECRTLAARMPNLEAAFHQGSIKPIEYLAATTDYDFQMVQVDDASLYQEQEAAYLASRDLAPRVKPAFELIARALEAARRDYSAEWREFYALSLQIQSADFKGDIMGVLSRCMAFAQQQGCDISSHTDFNAFLSLRERDRHQFQGMEEVKEVVEELLRRLQEKDPPDDYLSRVLSYQAREEDLRPADILNLDFDEVLALYRRGSSHLTELLAAALALQPSQVHQAESQRANELILSLAALLSLDWSRYSSAHRLCTTGVLYGEILKNSTERLSQALIVVAERILRGAGDRGGLWRNYQLECDLRRLERLFVAELTPKEVEELIRLLNAYAFARMSRAVVAVSGDSRLAAELNPFEDAWDLGLNRVARYYRYARQRSRLMIDQFMARVADTPEKVGVLMTGGFHSISMLRRLKRDGRFSSLTVQPHLDAPADKRGLYDELMELTNKR
jgi:hypothetical protein